MLELEAIYSFPVKSCGPNHWQSCQILPHGLQQDRSFMIVDSNGKFLTQREFPKLSRILPVIRPEFLHLSFQDKSIDIDLNTEKAPIPVEIWKSNVKASRLSRKADDWLSEILDIPVTLVRHTNATRRRKYLYPPFHQELEITFTDGYPIHIINQASLDDLGRRIGQPLDPLRFRPNFIVSGLEAYEEDLLDTVEGKGFKLRVVKPAGRCKIPNVNPETGQSDIGVLRELASYRRQRSKVNFGVYAYVIKSGEASVGEDLSICYK